MDEKFYYDGKVIHCTRQDFNQIHMDYKNDSSGNERMLSYDEVTGGTISVPVRFKQEEDY